MLSSAPRTDLLCGRGVDATKPTEIAAPDSPGRPADWSVPAQVAGGPPTLAQASVALPQAAAAAAAWLGGSTAPLQPGLTLDLRATAATPLGADALDLVETVATTGAATFFGKTSKRTVQLRFATADACADVAVFFWGRAGLV